MAEHHDHAHSQGNAHEQTHVHGTMDVTTQENTFNGFIRFWAYLFGGAIAILIFLALFNS